MALKANEYSTRQTFKIADTAKTSTSQFKVAYISASMTVSIASDSADLAIGIIDDCPSTASRNCNVIMLGIATGAMFAGTTVAIGDWLVAAAGGTLVVALTNSTSDQVIMGRALDVPASGGAVTIFVNPVLGGSDIEG